MVDICHQIVIIKLRHHCVLLVAGALLLIGIVFFIRCFFTNLETFQKGISELTLLLLINKFI